MKNGHILLIVLLGFACDSSNKTPVKETHPSISKDGSKILFSFDSLGSINLRFHTIEDSEVHQITNNHAVSTRGDWSPSGDWVVFDSDIDGDFEIFKIKYDGDSLTQLTNNDEPDKFAKWSPDGKRIVFFSDRDDNREVYVMNADGSEQINLTQQETRDGVPSWSPDGSKILFHSTRTGEFQLFTMNIDGTEENRFTQTNYPEEHGSWSPNGEHIAYYREDPERKKPAEIFIIDSLGKNPRQLTFAKDFEAIGEYSPPSWFPDSEHIVFWGKLKNEDETRFYIVTINGELHSDIKDPLMYMNKENDKLKE